MKEKLVKEIKDIVEFGRGTRAHHLSAFAAQSAFFVIMSFFPLMNIMLTLTKYLPITKEELISFIIRFVPNEFDAYIVGIVNDIFVNGAGAVTIISIIVAIWSAAKGIMAIRNGLNEVYNSRENKNYVIIRGISSIYTIAFIIVIVLLIIVNVFGIQIGKAIIAHFPKLEEITVLIIGVKGAVTFVVLFVIFICMYCIMPNRKVKLKNQLVGAFFSAFAWVACSQIFSKYVNVIVSKSYMYGSLTSIILIMIWLYFGFNMLLVGGEINQYLEKKIDKS